MLGLLRAPAGEGHVPTRTVCTSLVFLLTACSTSDDGNEGGTGDAGGGDGGGGDVTVDSNVPPDSSEDTRVTPDTGIVSPDGSEDTRVTPDTGIDSPDGSEDTHVPSDTGIDTTTSLPEPERHRPVHVECDNERSTEGPFIDVYELDYAACDKHDDCPDGLLRRKSPRAFAAFAE